MERSAWGASLCVYKEPVGSDDTGALSEVGTRGTAGRNRTECKANARELL